MKSQILVSLTSAIMLPVMAQAQQSSNLPEVTMDSFVYEAGDKADLIYGDEGDNSNGYLPPFEKFTEKHRIGSGIVGQRSEGLTTGQGSLMPSAAGWDEFIDPPNGEWNLSAPITPRKKQPTPTLDGGCGTYSGSGGWVGSFDGGCGIGIGVGIGIGTPPTGLFPVGGGSVGLSGGPVTGGGGIGIGIEIGRQPAENFPAGGGSVGPSGGLVIGGCGISGAIGSGF